VPAVGYEVSAVGNEVPAERHALPAEPDRMSGDEHAMPGSSDAVPKWRDADAMPIGGNAVSWLCNAVRRRDDAMPDGQHPMPSRHRHAMRDG